MNSLESSSVPPLNERGQWPILRVARALVTSPEGKDVLFVYRNGSHFGNQAENAGGKVEESDNGGDVRLDIIRELQEELGLFPDDYLLLEEEPFLDFMMFDPDHPDTLNTPYAKKLIVTYTFQVRLLPQATIQLSSEHSRLQWVRVQDALQVPHLTPYSYSAVAAFLRNNGRVTFSALSHQEKFLVNRPTYPRTAVPPVAQTR